jgi:hypothetical protein
VIRFARKALEVRVLDTQECVKLDVAIAVFVRSALRAARVVETGSLSERMRAALVPHEGDPDAFRDRLRALYGELAGCLERNEPWVGRGL